MDSTLESGRMLNDGCRSGGRRGGSCCCSCLSCLQVLFSTDTKFKIITAVLSGAILTLLLIYGHSHIEAIGFSYEACLTTSSACLLTTLVLLISFIFAPHCISTIRATQFEKLLNGLFCILYLSSGGYLASSVPMHMLIIYFYTFIALTVCYVLCFVASIVHGIEVYWAYRC